jgi:hypothetical protein
MHCRVIYPLHAYDGSEKEDNEGKASAEGRMNGHTYETGIDKRKVGLSMSIDLEGSCGDLKGLRLCCNVI